MCLQIPNLAGLLGHVNAKDPQNMFTKVVYKPGDTLIQAMESGTTGNVRLADLNIG